MLGRASRSGAGPVAVYLSRLRRRAALLHGMRALTLAAAASTIVFAVGALALGPLFSPSLAWVVWAAVVATVVAVLAWAARRYRPLLGAGAARLLTSVRSELASAARSAYELRQSPPQSASTAMIRAHEERVVSRLAETPPSAVLSFGWLRQRAIGLGVALLILALLALATERGRGGAYALMHPGERDARGERVVVAFGDVEAHLVYPSYLGRASVTVRDPTVLALPRGTSVEMRARARVDASAASLRVNDRVVPLQLDESERWAGRFVIREEGSIVLRLQRPEGDWVRDALERRALVIEDDPPRVSILQPADDLLLDEADELPIQWEAEDDVGVASAELVFQIEGAEENRRRIATYHEAERDTSAGGVTRLDLALLGLERGQSVSFWIEARDADVVSGPNVGRSRTVTLTLASEATRRDQRLVALQAVLDRAIQLLADRLERPAPSGDEAALRRFEALSTTTDAFVDALRDLAAELRGAGGTRPSDLTLYTEMASRVRRLLHQERLLHRPQRPGPHEDREEVDARAVTELEDDTLSLDDLLGRARIEDAAAIAHELEALRREIRSLISELRRTDSEEARRQLLAAVARAQSRMRELSRRLAEMGTSVPQEFMNMGEMPTEETASALAQLNEAVQRGDLDDAERLLNDLQHQLDALARALGQSEESFAEARFGPRDRALANAMDALASLEAEQQQLASRGTQRRSRAAERALETIGGRDNRIGQELAEDAREARETLQRVSRARLASFEQDTYDRARQRLVDAEDALGAGDLGEAREMTEAAADDLASLSRDLDLSALMFPGHEGETSTDAHTARQALAETRELGRQLDESLPDVASHLDAPDRQEMRGDLARQRAASEATERLERQFEEGPDGTPLVDDAGRQLREAMRAMGRAEEGLEATEPLESARQQEEAARRLTQLREDLEEQQRGGGGGGEGGSAQPDFRRPVDIPDADQFEGPMEQRRRLLDAMRASSPAGYEDAVRAYYEGLLR